MKIVLILQSPPHHEKPLGCILGIWWATSLAQTLPVWDQVLWCMWKPMLGSH